MQKEEFTLGKQEAPFNMAIATLEALRKILSHIEQLDLIQISDAEKQKVKVNLVKRFYVDACPLLNKQMVEKHKEVLEIVPKEIKVVGQDGKIKNHKHLLYDNDIDIKLNQHLINMQVDLQAEGYYMPPKRVLGTAVGSFR